MKAIEHGSVYQPGKLIIILIHQQTQKGYSCIEHSNSDNNRFEMLSEISEHILGFSHVFPSRKS